MKNKQYTSLDAIFTKKPAFTLVEMIIVLAIASLILSYGFTELITLRRSQELLQSQFSLLQNIRQARQKAMLLERSPRQVVYGIGLDLRQITNSSQASYSTFKYGYIDANAGFNREYPSTGPTANDLLDIETVIITSKTEGWAISAACGSNPVRYIVFEAVNGTTHAYTASGKCGGVDVEITMDNSGTANAQKIIIKSSDGDIYVEN